MQYLPHWKRLAFYGAAAGFLAVPLSPAAAWEGNYYYKPYPWDAGASTYWQPRWSVAPREHRRHKVPPRQATVKEDRKLTGPVTIVVSLAQQKATVFDGGGEIASTRVSTGVPGHPTPLGVFSVIQKQVYHESNLYSAAPMPYMQRITWSGIALHAGVVPDHPASHGCIRLPRDFAVRLYSMTKIGARVVVTNGNPAPVGIAHQMLMQPNAPSERTAESVPPALLAAADTRPMQSTHTEATTGSATSDAAVAPTKVPLPVPKIARQNATVSLFISRKQGKLYARQRFTTLFDMPVSISEPEKPIGTHVFTAVEKVDEGRSLRWNVLTIPSVTSEKRRSKEIRSRERQSDRGGQMEQVKLPSASEALDRVNIPEEARARVADLLTPGASLIISDNALSDETDSDTDFIVLTP